MVNKVRITGFGGQGVITAGYILGKAAAIYDNKHSIFTQSYGPEARGSACSAQVKISKDPILYPFIKEHDILLAMSQEGFDKHIGSTADKGTVIYDEDLVELGNDLKQNLKLLPIPSTMLAENNFDNRIVTNIIMLGFLTASTGLISETAIEEAVKSVVPERMQELNMKALHFGINYKPEKVEDTVVE
jgi:2-oxoglutarate ferredoxin oxidoreductase subunit gamma